MRKITSKKVALISLCVLLIALGLFIYLVGKPDKASNFGTTTGSMVHFTDYSSDDGTESTVILSGAIGDYGKATSTFANASGDARHSADLNLHLTHGSFKLSIGNLTSMFKDSVSKLHFNQDTCSGSVAVSSVAPVVSGSGTGDYEGIMGNFSLTLTLDEVVPKKNNCNATGTMLGQAIVITGTGKITRL